MTPTLTAGCQSSGPHMHSVIIHQFMVLVYLACIKRTEIVISFHHVTCLMTVFTLRSLFYYDTKQRSPFWKWKDAICILPCWFFLLNVIGGRESVKVLRSWALSAFAHLYPLQCFLQLVMPPSINELYEISLESCFDDVKHHFRSYFTTACRLFL